MQPQSEDDLYGHRRQRGGHAGRVSLINRRDIAPPLPDQRKRAQSPFKTDWQGI